MIKLRVLRWEIILDCLGESHVITRVPVRGKQQGQGKRRFENRRRQRGRGRLEAATLLALNMEEGAMSQGT